MAVTGKSRLRRSISKWASSTEMHERELRRTYADVGSTRIADAPDRERVRLRGTLRTVTLRPRGGVPALEAELTDGSGVLTVVWLGRRRIAGIAPGRAIQIEGRIGVGRGGSDHVQPALRAHPVSEPDQSRNTPTASVETVEAVVRRPAVEGAGRTPRHDRGRRPTVLFTVTWLTTRELRVALVASLAVAIALLVVRLVQRSIGPVRAQRDLRHRDRLAVRPTVRPLAAAARTTRPSPTSCPASSTTPATPWSSPSPA